MRLITPPVGLTALTDTDLVGQVARILTQAIVQGHLQPGAKVVEAAIARELGISRAPVREAARLLERQGLMVAHPRRGFFVRKLEATDIDEIYDLRICVECHAGVLAAKNLTPRSRDALRRQIDVLHETASLDDPARQVEEDYKFHRMICEIAGSARLLRLFDDLASELRMVIGLIGRLYDDPRRIAETHEAILEALEGGHPDIIEARLDYHIGAAWREVARLVRDIPSSTKGAAT
ncbi:MULTISPECIES: GntR family transcriptional regulator [Rhodopseudomonas]|uniref:GntR family transcriptional regulator n=1 Tax=Rhodopseudomonas palustris TaxID=1076 RepID=A0A0D7EYA4_RHOPL|nr:MULTISPECIES: GntR family transcriptional regulator [Rhodopseudomonas]KIZ45809.1 GntR family transcriptional regulator [Rhodopseudomonas palustris]MDF3812403.1 GntR family transcriptional regulator [Rhodopseudomonas sp. BAL398]WOK17250.1 GntR family transcriptional regulator [Rhodopseudomonas sp. BAL398]